MIKLKKIILLIIFILFFPSINAIWKPYLIGNWTFDNTYNEHINNYVGTSQAPFVTGYIGQAVNVSTYSIYYGEIYNLGGYTQNPINITIVSIIKLSPEFNNSYRSILASDSGGGGQYGFNLDVISGNLLRVYYGYYTSPSENNKNRRDSIYPIPTDKWIIVAGSMYNRTEMKLFLNGVEIKGQNQVNWDYMSQRPEITPFVIGYNEKGGQFKGLIDNTLLIRSYINVSDAYEIASLFGLADNITKQLYLNSTLDTLTSYDDWTNPSLLINFSGYLSFPDYVLNAVDNTIYPDFYDCQIYVDGVFQDNKSNINLSKQNSFFIQLPIVNKIVPIEIKCFNEVINNSKIWNLNVNTLPVNISKDLLVNLKFNDPSTSIMLNEVNNKTGICYISGLGINYPVYYPYMEDRKFDEAWFFPNSRCCVINTTYTTMNITGVTINLWFKPYAITTTYQNLIKITDDFQVFNPISYIDFSISNISLRSVYEINYQAGQYATLIGYYNFSEKTWYMVTASFGREGMKLYVNGQLIAKNITYLDWDMREWMLVGSNSIASPVYGYMDELNLWGRQLKDIEVYNLYNNMVEVYPDIKENTQSSLFLQDNLLSYHSFDYEVKDDLNYITYFNSSAIIVDEENDIGKGSLFCRGTNKFISSNNPFFNYSTLSYGSRFKYKNSTLLTNYLYSIGNKEMYIQNNMLFQNFLLDVSTSTLSPFNDNQWHSSIVVYKPFEKRVYWYIDGSLYATIKDRTQKSNFLNFVSICRNINNATSSYVYLDEFFIFNRTLSEEEISLISAGYQLITPTTPITYCFDVFNCSLRRYSLDENNSILKDTGLNKINATTNSLFRPLTFMNRGLFFNDTSTEINITSDNNLNFWDAKDFSISFWYKKMNNPSNTQTILVHKTNENNQFSTNIYQLNNGKISACVGRAYIDEYCISSNNLLNDAWYMITISYNKTTQNLNLFINETKIGNITFPFINTAPSSDIWQFKEIYSNRYFSFFLDEVRFYNFDISEQVLSLYNYLVSLKGCIPQYLEFYTECMPTNTYNISFYDIMECGFPPLNDTIVFCDYCVPNITNYTTECNINSKQIIFLLNNYDTCCAITNDYEDCFVPDPIVIPCVKVGVHKIEYIPSLFIDFFVEYSLFLISLISLIILLILFFIYKILKEKNFL